LILNTRRINTFSKVYGKKELEKVFLIFKGHLNFAIGKQQGKIRIMDASKGMNEMFFILLFRDISMFI